MDIARLTQIDGHYEFRDPSRSLLVRGAQPEWVLQAAAEVIGNFSRIQAESLVAELTALHTLGAADHADLAAARAEYRQRFDHSPRCSITLGMVDYIWASAEGPRVRPDEMAVPPLTLGPDMLVARP